MIMCMGSLLLWTGKDKVKQYNLASNKLGHEHMSTLKETRRVRDGRTAAPDMSRGIYR